MLNRMMMNPHHNFTFIHRYMLEYWYLETNDIANLATVSNIWDIKLIWSDHRRGVMRFGREIFVTSSSNNVIGIMGYVWHRVLAIIKLIY